MEREKYVDESWKESAAQEKERLETLTRTSAESAGKTSKHSSPETQKEAESGARGEDTPGSSSATQSEIDFLNYITSIAFQAMIFMGEIPNPHTNIVEKNVDQAKFFIDTLILLRDKTKGNLSRKESDTLNAAIYELQVKYVETAEREGAV